MTGDLPRLDNTRRIVLSNLKLSRPLRISPLLIARLTRERIASCAEPRKLRTSSCLSLAKLTAVVEPVEGDFSILADLDEVAVGITHIAAPFPVVIV